MSISRRSLLALTGSRSRRRAPTWSRSGTRTADSRAA